MSTKTQTIWGIIITIIVVLVAAIISANANLNLQSTENGFKAEIQLSESPAPATITEGDEVIEGVETGRGEAGEIEVKSINGEEIKTVEAVENNSPVMDVESQECPESEECGRGANYPAVDISSPQAFANSVLGKCIDVDGYYGGQCWDLMAAFWHAYTGRTLTTCGTGAAKGAIADGCWQKNAGTEFTMIWNPTDIQDGDIAFYSTGTWGHTGMAMGMYNNGYFTLLGQNQGGAACTGGGAAANIINLSTRDFIGAFRPNIFIKPEPEPEPEPTPEPVVDKCLSRVVVRGETMGSIMKECEGKITWGATMNAYANSWASKKLGTSVYYGWTHGSGYGLYAGDTITRSGV